MRILSISLFLILSTQIGSIAQSIKISAQILDQDNKEPLPFATIGLSQSGVGTISNGEGNFTLQIPESLKNEYVIVSYMGYTSKKLQLAEIQQSLRIYLEKHTIELEEVIVRPFSPQEYIRIIVNQIPDVYVSAPFSSTAYYREKFTENDAFVRMEEGIFKTYYANYTDTSQNQHQLLLHRKANDTQEIQFMKATKEKHAAKEKLKAEKKNEEYKEDNENQIIHTAFGGPEEIINSDFIKDRPYFLDSTQFKHFTYAYQNPVTFRDQELTVIGFKSKGTVEHLKYSGVIYVDPKTDAIVQVNFSGKFVIPLYIKPVLFAIGLAVEKPVFSVLMQYQQIDNKWYPDYFYRKVNAGLKKKYMFKKNELSDFTVEQIFKINAINTTNVAPIPAAKRYDEAKPFEDQIFNDFHLNFADFNVIQNEK